MRVLRLDHVQLAMPAGREPEAVAFYADLLGLPEVPKPANMAASGGCWFERGELKLHLGVQADFRPAAKAHPALVVEDLPALIDALRAAGHPVNEDNRLAGHDRIFTEDPFGNRIEFMQPQR